MCKHRFFIGLTSSKHGHNAIFVCVDKLSKMVHFMLTTTIVTAKETKKSFKNHIYKLHGIPLKLIGDRGVRFMGRFEQKVVLIVVH